MMWTNWLTATASAFAILAALIGAASYCFSKWKARQQRKERERLIRFAEAAAERDIKAGFFDHLGEAEKSGKNSN